MSEQAGDYVAPECDCDSMGGRFGAHRPECPWQVAFEAQLAREKGAALVKLRTQRGGSEGDE